MPTQLAVAERALGLLAISDTVSNLSAPTTKNEKAISRYYDSVVENALKFVPWAFATRYYDFLAQPGVGTATVTGGNTLTFSVDQDTTVHVGDTITIGTAAYVLTARTSGTVWSTTGANVGATAFTIAKQVTDDPTKEWTYAYRVPTKVLMPRKMVDGNRTPIRSNRAVFRIGQDATGKLLYTDLGASTFGVVLEYTEDVAETQWPEDFAMGVAGMLAFHVAPLLTEGDPNQLGARAYQTGMAWLQAAAQADGNQMVPDDEPASDVQQFRNGGGWQRPDIYRVGYL